MDSDLVERIANHWVKILPQYFVYPLTVTDRRGQNATIRQYPNQ